MRRLRPRSSTEAKLLYAGVPLVPMAAVTAAAPFEQQGWTYEIKWDGWRALALIVGGEVRLISRRGVGLLRRFPELGTIAKSVRGGTVLEGEIIAEDGTLESFDSTPGA